MPHQIIPGCRIKAVRLHTDLHLNRNSIALIVNRIMRHSIRAMFALIDMRNPHTAVSLFRLEQPFPLSTPEPLTLPFIVLIDFLLEMHLTCCPRFIYPGVVIEVAMLRLPKRDIEVRMMQAIFGKPDVGSVVV